MPRKKTIEIAEPQVFHVSDHAKVTIEWEKGHRPKFFQPSDGVVIIGEHACGPVAVAPHQSTDGLSHSSAPVIRNFEVAEDDPGYLAFKAQHARPPAPPDFSPPVETSADLMSEFARKVKAETGVDIGEGIDPVAAVAAAGG